jgi:alcohol dehydrogenase class IV
MTEQLSFIGQSAFDSFEEIIKKYNPKKIFLVRGNVSYAKSGAEKMFNKFFAGRNIKITEFQDYSANPKIEEMETGLAILRNKKADLILATGGGSTLDVAKAIRLFFSFEKNNKAEYKQINELIPLVAVPTTAGSGSEATHFAVLYKNGKKCSIEHDSILPDAAIVDPVFTLSASPYLTACTGFDALAQAIEAYWNINATPKSDNYAEKAIAELCKYLPILVNNGKDIILREKVSVASFFAGKAINITKTTAPHAFSYPFTTHYGYPHGHAVAMTMPFFMQFNYADTQEQLSPKLLLNEHHEKMQKLYSLLEIKDKENAVEMTKSFISQIGLNIKLPANFNPDLIVSNVNAERLSNNPRKMTEQDIKKAILNIENK